MDGHAPTVFRRYNRSSTSAKRHNAAEPKRQGYYLTQGNLSDSQTTSWDSVKVETLPLSSVELGRMAEDTDDSSSKAVSEALLALSNSQRTNVLQVVAEVQKEEESSAQWFISHLRTYEDKSRSTNVTETDRILLILERVDKTIPSAADEDNADPSLTRQEELDRKVGNIARQAFKSTVSPRSSMIRMDPSRTAPPRPPQRPPHWSRVSSEDERRGSNSSSEESWSEVVRIGSDDEPRESKVKIKPEPEIEDGRKRDRQADREHPDLPQHDFKIGTDSKRDHTRRRSSTAGIPHRTSYEAFQSQIPPYIPTYPSKRPQYPPMGSNTGSLYPPMYPNTGSLYPSTYSNTLPPYPPSFSNPFSPYPPTYSSLGSQYPPMYPSTQPEFSQAYPYHAPQHSQAYPHQGTQHPQGFSNMWMPYPQTFPHRWTQPKSRRSSSSSSERSSSPPPGPTILPKDLEMKDLEINALKERLQHQLQLNLKREQIDRKKAEEMQAQKAEAALAQRDAEQRALRETELNALRSLIEKYEEDRDAREVAWRKEKELEVAARAAEIAKAEEDKRRREAIEAAAARAKDEAEKKAAAAAKKAHENYQFKLSEVEKAQEESEKRAADSARMFDEERVTRALIAKKAEEEHTRELSSKVTELERLQVRLEEQAETRRRYEQVEHAKLVEQATATAKREAEEEREKDIRSRDREIMRLQTILGKQSRTSVERVRNSQKMNSKSFRESPDDIYAGAFGPQESSGEEWEESRSTLESSAGHKDPLVETSSQIIESGISTDSTWNAASEPSPGEIAIDFAREPLDDQALNIDEALRTSFIDKFARKCYESLASHSARARFHEDDIATQFEYLLRDFAILLQRTTRGDRKLTGMLTLIFQRRSQIKTRLRDLVLSLGEIEVPPSQTTANSLSSIRDVTQRKRSDYYSSSYMNHRLEALFDTSAFGWLIERVESQSLFAEAGTTVSDNRCRLARAIVALPIESPLRLSLEWDLISFLTQQYPANHTDFTETIVFCGLAKAAYATTAGEYMRTVWPRAGPVVIECIQAACRSSPHIARLEKDGLSLEVRFEFGRTLICISAHTDKITDVLEIAEACMWLAAACRANDIEECPAYSSVSIAEPTSDGTDNIEIRTRLQNINTSASQDGLCWVKMVKNPVLARGYPIPRRHDPAKQQGLELSLDLMIALGHAHWATTFGSTFVLKGLISALVPVLEIGSSLVWHFSLNDDVSRMTYQQACASASEPGITINGRNDLQERRHFVGVWSRSTRIMAGGSDASLYNDLQPSTSKPIKQLTISLSNISLSAGQYITFGGAFKIGRKDTAPSLAKTASDAYGIHIRHASNMQVLFFGTKDRRGWLLDGASALMHLARSWMSCEGNKQITPEELGKLAYRDERGDRDSAVRVLTRNQSRNIRIFEDLESQWEESRVTESSSSPYSTSDSGYFSSSIGRRSKHKTIISEWSFKDLILDLWHVLEAMHDKLHGSKFHAPEFTVRKPTLKPILAGWETKDVLTTRGPFESRGVELMQSAGPWLQYVREQSAIVLLAWTFGDLILPEKGFGECSRVSRMPTGFDYLAVPLYILYPEAKRFLRDNEESSEGCVQITDYTYWHSFEVEAHHCRGPISCACKITSRMGHKAKHSEKTGRSLDAHVFARYPYGVAIIGDPKMAERGSSRWSHWHQKASRHKQSPGQAPESMLQIPMSDYKQNSRSWNSFRSTGSKNELGESPPPPSLIPTVQVIPVDGEILTPRASNMERRSAESDLDGTHFENQAASWHYLRWQGVRNYSQDSRSASWKISGSPEDS